MELSRCAAVITVIGGVAAVALFTPYEAYVEGILALGVVIGAMLGFLMQPRREVYYIRTSVRLVDPDRDEALEQDFLAVRAELVRLWLLFVPTFLAAAIFMFFAAGGPAKSTMVGIVRTSGSLIPPNCHRSYFAMSEGRN